MSVELTEKELGNLDKTIEKLRRLIVLEVQLKGQALDEDVDKLRKALKIRYKKEMEY